MFFATAYWILVCVASCASHYDEDNHVSYTGAQVWRTDLQGAEDVLVIKKLIDDKVISIWNLSPVQADYLVSVEDKVMVHRQLKTRNLNHIVLIMDVQRRVDSLQPEPTLWDEKSLRMGHRLDFQNFPTLKIINEYINYLAESYPSLCSLQTIGRTAENRTIQMLNISNGNPANKVILITAGIHSREWVTITSALYILNELATKFDYQPDYLKNKNWLIIPVLNPDGYEYSHTKNRLWRKNRSGYRNCKGVDINRNFALNWNIPGITVNDHAEKLTQGPTRFPKPNLWLCRYITFLQYLLQKTPNALIDLHSYGQLVLFPWCASSNATDNAALHRNAAQAMSQAILTQSGRKYKFGPTYHMIYPATGALIDWAYSSGVLQSFAIETRDTGGHGFLLPAHEIEDTGKELLAAVGQLAKELDVVHREQDDATWF